jgi:XTP/dITP diphosphohydrolase
VIHTLVLASGNRGKLLEIKALLAGLPLKIIAADEALRPPPTVVEDGATFTENATKKAREVGALCLAMTLADDSGLEVDALAGRPGVRSARFAHARATDAENNAALIAALAATCDPSMPAEPEDFPARFRCVLALFDPYGERGQGELALAEGVCEGSITLTARGTGGFGYDPLFVVKGEEKTMAELSEEEKNKKSHRARACMALRPVLERMIAAREADVRRVEDAASA